MDMIEMRDAPSKFHQPVRSRVYQAADISTPGKSLNSTKSDSVS